MGRGTGKRGYWYRVGVLGKCGDRVLGLPGKNFYFILIARQR